MEGLSKMEITRIEEKADKLLEKINYAGGEVDIIEVANGLGFKIGNAELSNDEDGFIIVDNQKDELFGIKTSKLIGVNAKRDLAFKRFVIAHEIGHFQLHYDSTINNGMYAHRDHPKGKSNNENDADYFAAYMLMPTRAFNEAYNSIKDRFKLEDAICLLVNKFNAPQESVARRIDEVTK